VTAGCRVRILLKITIVNISSVHSIIFSFTIYYSTHTVHNDVLQRWKVDVLSSSRFIRSYESALQLGLCENIPHKRPAFYSENFVWQMVVSAVVIAAIVYLGYRCRAGGEVDHSDDIVYHH